MGLNIPSGIPASQINGVNSPELITPPSAPTVIENVQEINPRVALNMPTPVASSADSSRVRGSIAASQANNAVLLELTGTQAQQATVLDPLLAQSLSKMDSLGSLALGQLLSDILLNEPANAGNQSTQVNWPGHLAQSQSVLGSDLKAAMNMLYQNLQNSGIFAANQLKKLLMPASSIDEQHLQTLDSISKQASGLLQELATDNPTVKDAVKLLLRGDLVWQGQLLPNLQAKIYRSDAWETDPQNSSQLLKGSSLTMEVNLPNLGKIEVIGIQFGDQLNIQVKASDASNQILLPQFDVLLQQIRDQIDAQANVILIKADAV
jgi:hypothetical protein